MTPTAGGHGLGPTRARVLGRLQGTAGASAQEVAESLGVHDNTVRFHLEALVASGFADRRREAPNGKGRPRTLYRATQAAPPVQTAHLRDLAQALVRHLVLASDDPAGVAEAVGRAWGREMAAGATDSESPHDDGLTALLRHTRAMGFGTSTPDARTIEFHTCPYRELAPATRDAICTLHLGMMRGFLEARGSALDMASLVPGPVCVAHFAADAAPDALAPDPVGHGRPL